MEARVVITNHGRGMYAAQMVEGGYVIFELLDTAEPEFGDIVSHPDFYSLGSATIRNFTQMCAIFIGQTRFAPAAETTHQTLFENCPKITHT